MYYFRADGSAVTGAGHLMRCLTVAQELQKRIEHPEELCFLCAEQASAELLQSWNMPVKILGTDPADLEGELSALEGLIRGSGHVFLVDSYAVTDAYLQALHRFGRVYLLDDMQQHAFPVDGVINYNLFASREKYRELYGSSTGQYLGAAYVPVNDFAVMIAKKAVNSFVRTPYESIKDELFLKELLDSLAMSGIANEIAGSSAPTSGSEHLISHALDKILEVPQLHGIQVGIATYIMAKVQDHRYIRVSTVLKDTGFWDYVATLHMKKADFLKAIDMSPTIKPHRHTYLHEEKYREAAKKLVLEDEVLNRVLED